jgi:PTS system nitrogen regulatory IIA component
MSYHPLNLKQASDLLQMDVSDIRSMALNGELPAQLQGNTYLFDEQELKTWLSHEILRRSRCAASINTTTARSAGCLLPLLCRPEYIEPHMQGRSQAAILRELTTLAERTGALYNPKDLLEQLIRREKMASTAVEGGLALVHPFRNDEYTFSESFICLGVLDSPVYFGDAPDNSPTDIFFLICCCDSTLHLQVLSRLSALCRQKDFPNGLREAGTAAEMHALLMTAEQSLLQRDAKE